MDPNELLAAMAGVAPKAKAKAKAKAKPKPKPKKKTASKPRKAPDTATIERVLRADTSGMFREGNAPDPYSINEPKYYIGVGAKGVNYTLRVKEKSFDGYVSDRYVKTLGPRPSDLPAKVAATLNKRHWPVYWTAIDVHGREKARASDVIKFGKYNDAPLDFVAVEDPEYIVWMLDQLTDARSFLRKPKQAAFVRELEKMRTHPNVRPLLDARAAKERERERRAAEREAAKAKSQYVGTVGERIELELTHEFQTCWDTQYGSTCLMKYRDNDGNTIVWFSSGRGMWVDDGEGGERPIEPGDKVRAKGTVKKHDTRDGEKQTVVGRLSIVKPKAKKKRK